jgi:tetratricopeptide (TPR) repeat protein
MIRSALLIGLMLLLRRNSSSENYGYALKTLNGCLDCDDDLAPVYSNLAAIAGKREDLDQAKILVEKAIELDAEYAGAYANLGNIHRLDGDFISAEAAYLRALAIDPKSATARSNLDNLTSGDRGKLAWQHVLRGDEHSRLGEGVKAIEEYEVAIELGLKQHRVFSNLGVLYAQAGWDEQAEANFLKALEVEPGFAEAHRNLGVLYYKAGELLSGSGEHGAAASEFRRARVAVNQGLKYMPDDPGLRQISDIVEKALGNE